GYRGAWISDLFFQFFGVAAFLIPLLTFALAWRWIRSEEIIAGGVKISGWILLTASISAGCSFTPLHLFGGMIPIGGTVGLTLARFLVDGLNQTGAALVTVTAFIISIYLVSTFTVSKLGEWFAGPIARYNSRLDAWQEWRESMRQRAAAKAKERAAQRFEKEQTRISDKKKKKKPRTPPLGPPPDEPHGPPLGETPAPPSGKRESATTDDPPPHPNEHATIPDPPIVPGEAPPPPADPFPA